MSSDSRRTDLTEQIRECVSCGLCKLMPFKPVPGIGPLSAQIVVVGEAPGHDESVIEEPFVGLAGRMLDRLFAESGIDREQVFICNTVNCRPTDTGKKNRPPKKTEIEACKHWLFKQIELVKPKIVFTLGKVPTSTILSLKPTFKLGDYLGNEYAVKTNDTSYLVIPNYHPSYLLQYGKTEIELAVQIFKKGLSYV